MHLIKVETQACFSAIIGISFYTLSQLMIHDSSVGKSSWCRFSTNLRLQPIAKLVNSSWDDKSNFQCSGMRRNQAIRSETDVIRLWSLKCNSASESNSAYHSAVALYQFRKPALSTSKMVQVMVTFRSVHCHGRSTTATRRRLVEKSLTGFRGS
jgi:hypothetical protein